MKNLLLLGLLIAGAWYFLADKPAAPPPPALVAQVAPPPRVDYSGVRTFYSPLNDPPAPANGGNGVYSSAVVLGGTSPTQSAGGGYNTPTTGNAPSAANADRATSSLGLGGAGNR